MDAWPRLMALLGSAKTCFFPFLGKGLVQKHSHQSGPAASPMSLRAISGGLMLKRPEGLNGAHMEGLELAWEDAPGSPNLGLLISTPSTDTGS